MPSTVTRDVWVRREVSALGKGAARGIDRGLRCCQTGGEDVLAPRQWAPASAERPILRIPVSCLLSTVSRGLLNRGHVLGRHLSCNYSTRIRFWWCVMITNNYCAFHASNRPRWGPRVLIQKRERGEDREEGMNVKKWKDRWKRKHEAWCLVLTIKKCSLSEGTDLYAPDCLLRKEKEKEKSLVYILL